MFDFRETQRSKKKNGYADALSRMPRETGKLDKQHAEDDNIIVNAIHIVFNRIKIRVSS